MSSSRPRRIAAAAVLLAVSLGPAAGAGDWLNLVDRTSTRLVADPTVGASDTEEKDYAWGDVDKDGDIDLVVVRKQPFTTPGKRRNVLFLNEDGVLTDRTSTLAPDFLDLTNDRDVALVDVDNDTWLDIVTAPTFQDQPRILMNLGNASAEWQGFSYDADRLPFLESDQGFGPFFCGLGVGDVNGDGLQDLYFADYGGNEIGEGNDLNDRLLINDITNPGHFLDETEARTQTPMIQSCFGTQADIGDMNGDGFPDVVKTTGIGSSAPIGCPKVSILYNDGTGNFVTEKTVNSDSPYHAAVADFTQDDRLDLFVVDDVWDHYLINTGNDGDGFATFDTHTLTSGSPKTNGFGGNVTFADMDRDGILDVLVADVDVDISGCDRRLGILRGQGPLPNVSYSDPLGGNTRAWTPNGTFDIAPFDIDGDGGMDLVIGTCTGTLVFLGPNPQIFDDGFETGDTDQWDNSVE